jgi:hypothetical protein
MRNGSDSCEPRADAATRRLYAVAPACNDPSRISLDVAAHAAHWRMLYLKLCQAERNLLRVGRQGVPNSALKGDLQMIVRLLQLRCDKALRNLAVAASARRIACSRARNQRTRAQPVGAE